MASFPAIKLIPTVSGEHDFYTGLTLHLQAEERRNRRAIPKGLVVRRCQTRDRIEGFFGSNKIFMGVAVEMLRRHSGKMNLIVRSFFETNRKGFDPLGR